MHDAFSYFSWGVFFNTTFEVELKEEFFEERRYLFKVMIRFWAKQLNFKSNS